MASSTDERGAWRPIFHRRLFTSLPRQPEEQEDHAQQGEPLQYAGANGQRRELRGWRVSYGDLARSHFTQAVSLARHWCTVSTTMLAIMRS
jgi:hypothetical protein